VKYIGHGNKEIVERVLSPIEAKEKIKKINKNFFFNGFMLLTLFSYFKISLICIIQI